MSITLPTNLTPHIEDRFWSGIQTTDEGCWLWVGNRHGRIYWDGKEHSVANWAYTRFVRPIPPHHHLQRTCLRPTCVNPEHHRLPARLTLIERLKAKIEMPPDSDCWLWTAAMVGPGQNRPDYCDWRQGSVNVRRMLYEHLRDPLPPARFILMPHCGERRCVNPWHIEPKRVWSP